MSDHVNEEANANDDTTRPIRKTNMFVDAAAVPAPASKSTVTTPFATPRQQSLEENFDKEDDTGDVDHNVDVDVNDASQNGLDSFAALAARAIGSIAPSSTGTHAQEFRQSTQSTKQTAHTPYYSPLNGDETQDTIYIDGTAFANMAAATTTTADATPNHNGDDEYFTKSGVVAGAVANLCSATLGAGVLALPASIAQAGIVGGMALLAMAGLATLVSIRLLVQAIQRYQLESYEALCQTLFGTKARRAVELCIVVFCQGCAVAYLIAVADILEQAHLLIRDNRDLTLLLVWTVTCLPLSLLKRMQTLQWTSALGIASIATLLFAAIVHLIQDLDGGTSWGHHSGNNSTSNGTTLMISNHDFTIKHQIMSNSTTGDDITDSPWWPMHGWVSLMQACPIILFAFSCQVNVCAIFLELPAAEGMPTSMDAGIPLTATDTLYHPSKVPLMQKVATRAVTLCGLLYAGMAIVTLADFGPHRILPNILQNYNLRQDIMQVAAASMAVAVLMAFPLNIFPARVTCLGLWRESSTPSLERGSTANLDLTMALLQDFEQDTEANNTGNEISPEHEQAEITPPQPDLPADLRNGEEGTDESESTDWFRHIAWTVILSGSALGLALVVPDISVVFSILGGTTSSWLGFCVPGLLGLRLEKDAHPDDRSWTRCILSWLLLVGGIVVGLVTTALTIYSLAK